MLFHLKGFLGRGPHGIVYAPLTNWYLHMDIQWCSDLRSAHWYLHTIRFFVIVYNLLSVIKTNTADIYGSKAAGREKSALNVPTSPSLKESPCPNHPSYRLGSFTQLEIYICSTRTRIFTFLECQETYAGKGWNFLKLQEIWIGETAI